jgi:hypothetical protein
VASDHRHLTDEELAVVLEELERGERTVSARRGRLHARIDFVRSSGNADGLPATPAQLEALAEQEREISRARKQLHARITALREERRRRTTES